MIYSLEVFLSVEDRSVVSGPGPRWVVCSREGSGQQLLRVEGTLTAISRTKATTVKPLSPPNTTFTLRIVDSNNPVSGTSNQLSYNNDSLKK